jgi:hypothetical protein
MSRIYHRIKIVTVVGSIFPIQVDLEMVYPPEKIDHDALAPGHETEERKGLPDMSEGIGVGCCVFACV